MKFQYSEAALANHLADELERLYWAGLGRAAVIDGNRLKRLAAMLDQTAAKDEERIRQEKEIGALRREAAFDLYAICSNFVRSVNTLTTKLPLELSPEEYSPESFDEVAANLFQINAHGRLIQIAFEATGPLISNEEFRTPYTIAGEVRSFNQESLDGLGIVERQLFLCIQGGQTEWRFFNTKTHRQGAFDEDFLADLLEELLK